MNHTFHISFWGVRGSCPISTPNTRKYGGNTSCVQVQIGERLIIFDAGTGIIQLGNVLLNSNKAIKGDIFITHAHWDHIQGFPFFPPAFGEGNEFTIYGKSNDHQPFSSIIKNIMNTPYFPAEWDQMQANFSFTEVTEDERIDLGDGIVVKTLNLNHPGGCLGYRVDYAGRSCCYITDTEYTKSDTLLHSFIQDTDVLILDTQFTEEEYSGNTQRDSKVGWGHSTWQKGALLSKEMNVKNLLLFHHDINRNDDEIDIIEKDARKIHPYTIAAYEGLTIRL